MMADPNFRHAILYLSHHSADDGALGFILNRPLGQTAGELDVGEPLEHIAHAPIYEGGPVQRNQVIVATLEWDPAASACKFEPMEKPQGEFALPAGHDDKLRVRADADDHTWHRIMCGLGPMYRLLADAPPDASQN